MTKVKNFLKELYTRFSEHEVAGLSAQLAYYFLLSIFPFMIFLVALLGYVPLSFEDIQSAMQRYLPQEAMNLLSENIDSKNGGLLSVGILGTIWSASNGINAIMRAFNRAYEVDEDRSFIKSRLIAIVLTIAMVVVLIVALLLPVLGKAIGTFIFSYFGLSTGFLQLWEALRWVISSVIVVLVLTTLYILAPNHHVNLKQSFTGAAFATISWQIVSLGFSYYLSLNASSYSATYGSLGAVIILMLWFYLFGMIIILGGEINAMLKERNAFKHSN